MTASAEPTISRRVVVLSDRDNVATVLDGVALGASLDVGGRILSARQAIPAGHKVALRAIATGDAVVKYGEPIGRASHDIGAGDHVHVHNLQSDRGRGDREQPERSR
jgi:altronate dehydratase